MTEETRLSLPTLPPFKTVGWVIAAFFALGLLVYGASLTNEFVRWDDGLLITENPIVWRITPRNVAAMFSTYDPELYIPLTFVSYAVDYSLGGGSPVMFHLQSLAWHIGNALLVAWLFLLLLKDRKVALACGLLFLLHPLHTEAVAWASGRKDVLSAFFCMLSIILYLYHRERGGKWTYLWSLALFVCALLSKVIVITLPVLLLLLDFSLSRPINRRMFVDKIPYVALSVLFGIVAIFGKSTVIAKSSLLEKILMAAKSTVFYVEKMAWPTNLSVLYPYVGKISLSEPAFFVPMMILVSLLALVIFAGLKRALKMNRVPQAGMPRVPQAGMPALSVGFLFFLITIAPTFVNFAKGDLDIYFASDRYAYLGSIGLLFILGAFLVWLSEKQGRSRTYERSFAAAGAVVLLLFALLSYRQSLTWKDTETLFRNVLAKYPQSHVAHANLGNAYRRKGEYDLAIESFKQALALQPHSRTYANLGAVYRALGRIDEAKAEYDKALASNEQSKEAHFGLGIVHLVAGELDEAEAEYLRALEIDPHYEEARVNLGSLYLRKGDRAKAIAAYLQALETNPYFADGHYNLGVLYAQAGQTEEAMHSYANAISIDPKNIAARLNYGVLLFNSGEKDKAVAQFRAVLNIDPNNGAAKKALMQIGA